MDEESCAERKASTQVVSDSSIVFSEVDMDTTTHNQRHIQTQDRKSGQLNY